MDRDDKQVASSLADAALGIWEESRKLLIDSQPDRALIADRVVVRIVELSLLAKELRE